ncbi:MAG: MiaB/RimO family radical SAM methylthiotransferase [Candidatus Omnitrophota bacterium]|nr:MAG: MiaB/RimO family radical SAM methylthiotransferase [Candidatus Omnitrophota bacterium]
MKKNPAIGIVSLGCPRNLVDSEAVVGRLHRKGYQIVDIKDARVAIVNTCAFIDDAKKESIDMLLDLVALKKEGKLKKIIAYGCLVQRYKKMLVKEFPEIDAFVGRISLNHTAHNFTLTPAHYTYLKICEGCLNNCSYCVIPKIKQRFRSLDVASVLCKTRQADSRRVSEVNIIGQDITGFGTDLVPKVSLTSLLKKILAQTRHIKWFRLLYLYPSRITDELLALIRQEPRICKYIDVPIQHVNDRILRAMNRHVSKKDICLLLDKIRKALPNAVLRTSVIVGFPSETEKEFKELLRFIRAFGFERLGAFMYSREEDTPAYALPGQVSVKTKQDRFNEVMACQQKISEALNKKFLGKTLDVLIDEQEGNSYLGRTQYDAPEVDGVVYVCSKKRLRCGEFVKARIYDTLEYDLVGEALDEHCQ